MLSTSNISDSKEVCQQQSEQEQENACLEDTDVVMVTASDNTSCVTDNNVEVDAEKIEADRLMEALSLCVAVVVSTLRAITSTGEGVDNVGVENRSINGSLRRLKQSLDENFESFGSEGSAIIGEIFELIDGAETDRDFELLSDPDLEETFASMVDGVVHNPGQISEFVNSKVSGLEESITQDSFDRIGGKGTLREIWLRLKRLHQVSGVKRKLDDRDWECNDPTSPTTECSSAGSDAWLIRGDVQQRQMSGSASSSSSWPELNDSASVPGLATSESESSDSDNMAESADSGLSSSSVISGLRRGLQLVRVADDVELVVGGQNRSLISGQEQSGVNPEE